MILQMITESESKSLESVYPEIANHPLPTAEEMEVILDRFKAGEKGADEELKNAYIRFVASVAKRYLGQGVSKEELLEIGVKGLLIAAQKYDKKRGIKFIIYAVWWIRQSIQQAVNERAK